MVFPNGECLMTANLAAPPSMRPEDLGNNRHSGVATVHPAVAALYDTGATTAALLIGLRRADEAADWRRAEEIGTAMLEVFRRKGNYPNHNSVDKDAAKKINWGRLPTALPVLHEQLERAATMHYAEAHGRVMLRSATGQDHPA